MERAPVTAETTRRDPSRCRVCGFTLGYDEGLAGGICDSCDEEIVQHRRDQEAEWDADDGADLADDIGDEIDHVWNRGDAENFWASGGFDDDDGEPARSADADRAALPDGSAEIQ